jgi:hypothetical protein
VQPDLLGLEISKGELRRLIGVDADDVFRPSIFRNSEKRWSFLLNELLIGLALTPIIVGVIYTFIIFPTLGSSIPVAIILLIVVPILVAAGRWFWLKKSRSKLLINLLDEVDKYHAVIKAIAINDQLEETGHPGVSLSDREKVIQGLQLTREDLVRALKIERILRENKDLISTKTDLFSNNLRNLEAMQVSSDRASEYGRLLNEALEIAVGVEEEMRKLQRSGSR